MPRSVATTTDVSPLVPSALDALYAELPEMECRGLCQEFCGPIDMSTAERDRIREQDVEIPPLSLPCPALTSLGTCGIREVRPLVCRLWGSVEAMACPWGCRPEGGFLDDATAMDLIGRALEIGGQPASLPAPSREQIRGLLTDPDIAAAVGAIMRGEHQKPGGRLSRPTAH